MVPLLLESVLLLSVIFYLGFTQLLSPDLLRGVRLPGATEPEREIGARKLFAFLYGSAPLFGLFGTVVGLTLAFGQVGQGDSGAILEALATQLYTTAYGLVIAIPAYAFHTLYPWRYDEPARVEGEASE